MNTTKGKKEQWMNSGGYFIKRLKQEKKPILFLLSRILWRARFSEYLIVKCQFYRLRFFPTSISAEKWVYPDFRKEDEDFFTFYLRSGDVVIDIGANVGTLTLTAAHLVGSSGKVFSIEAHPLIFSYLKKNVELNNFKNVALFNAAIGERNGFIQFSNKLYDELNEVVTNNGLQIEVKKLDDLLSDHLETVNLLKVDVEGYEKFIFQGALNTLKKTECIYFESWEQHFIKYNYSTLDVLGLLKNSGFKLYKLKHSKLKLIPVNYSSEICENLLAIRNIRGFSERTGLSYDENL